MSVRTWLLAATTLAAGCTSAGVEGTGDTAVAARADTALLSPESVAIAGFTTAPVTREVWRDTWKAPARLTLDVASTEPIGSIVEGRVVRVYAMPGDRVREGEVLVAIHSHEMMDARSGLARARAEVTRAETGARIATSAAERGERLYTLKAIALAELERLRGAAADAAALRDGAAAELVRAEGMLEHLLGEGAMPEEYDPHWVLIRAPLSGLVTSRSVQPGNVVLMGAPLLTVSRTSALTLVLQLPEAATGAARVGAPVQFAVHALPGQTFEARVERVFPAVDTVTRTLEVHARVGDHRGLLRAEMFADAELWGASAGRTSVVPSAAVQSFEGDTVVISARPLEAGLVLEAVPVRVGRRTAARTEIVSGIDSGTVVVVGGAAVAKAEILKRRGG